MTALQAANALGIARAAVYAAVQRGRLQATYTASGRLDVSYASVRGVLSARLGDTRRNRQIRLLHTRDGVSYGDIGRRFGMPRDRVEQICNSAPERMMGAGGGEC